MGKYRTKIIGTIVVLLILIVAWFQGERYNVGIDAADLHVEASIDSRISSVGVLLAVPVALPLQTPALVEYDLRDEGEVVDSCVNEDTISKDIGNQDPSPYPIATVTESTSQPTYESVQDSYDTASDYSPEPVTEPDPPQDVIVADGSFTVTLSVRADTILDNMHLLSREKHGLVPADGVIFPPTVVRAYEGESVFNVLQREMRRGGIHMAFRNTPIYNSAYVMAINNLYEFDVGRLSGWMYKVNGQFPNFGSSRYILSPGDVIEWVYTCDLGRDIGGYWLGGGQQDD